MRQSPPPKRLPYLSIRPAPAPNCRRAMCRKQLHALALKPSFFDADGAGEFDSLFATMAERKAGALLVTADPSLYEKRQQLIELAARYRLPAIYEWRLHAVEGGLMSYGTVLTDAYSQVGHYAGRILKGEKPGDLPVVQPTHFQFVINLKTAKTLGLEIPPTLSARADEVIE